MTFVVEIQDVVVNVDITEDDLTFELVEDHIDIDIIEESINIDIIEDTFSIDLVEDVITVTLDDSCVCTGSGGGDAGASENYYCNGTLVVGDLVYSSSTIDRYAIKAIDNNSINPVMGIVTSIVSINTVEVTHLGFFNVSVTLERGKKVFVSETGLVTTTILLTNYLQVLGVAISESTMYLNPELRRCRRLSY